MPEVKAVVTVVTDGTGEDAIDEARNVLHDAIDNHGTKDGHISSFDMKVPRPKPASLRSTLHYIAGALDRDLGEVTGLVMEVWPTTDADTDEDVTEKVWNEAQADHKRSTDFLRELADRLPEFIQTPPRED